MSKKKSETPKTPKKPRKTRQAKTCQEYPWFDPYEDVRYGLGYMQGRGAA